MLTRTLVGCAAAVVGLVVVPGASGQSHSNMKDQLIFHYCSKAMQGDFSKAGRTPPAGMVDFTCNCVVQQIGGRATIEQAKAICQANAQSKYSVQ